jgi:hypothetical protein
VRNISRDIEEISWLHDRVVLKALVVPHVRNAAQRVDRRWGEVCFLRLFPSHLSALVAMN